jgi:hypothetical protein
LKYEVKKKGDKNMEKKTRKEIKLIGIGAIILLFFTIAILPTSTAIQTPPPNPGPEAGPGHWELRYIPAGYDIILKRCIYAWIWVWVVDEDFVGPVIFTLRIYDESF